jgi:hypothetical protein
MQTLLSAYSPGAVLSERQIADENKLCRTSEARCHQVSRTNVPPSQMRVRWGLHRVSEAASPRRPGQHARRGPTVSVYEPDNTKHLITNNEAPTTTTHARVKVDRGSFIKQELHHDQIAEARVSAEEGHRGLVHHFLQFGDKHPQCRLAD